VSNHNELAIRTSKRLLGDLHAGSAAWSLPDLTPAVTLSSWFDEWPRPDLVYADPQTDRSLAVEFKPPGHGKREYVTGLGQCLTYLNTFDYALLVLPMVASDGFEIGTYLGKTLRAEALKTAPLGVLAYDKNPESDIFVVETLRKRNQHVRAKTHSLRRTFWAYWRDLSQYDLLSLLELIDRHGAFPRAWDEFWTKRLRTGKALTWEGKRRTRYKSTGKAANGVNTLLSLRHTALVSSDGRLTLLGLKLLQIGKIYGPASLMFRDELARRVLIEGRHIDLIYWVSEIQPLIKPSKLRDRKIFLQALDAQLVADGVIRKPAASGKETYLRDEPKLWNKLGLLQQPSRNAYFIQGTGLRFDWRRITSLLASP
jgi:hypothetical protein